MELDISINRGYKEFLAFLPRVLVSDLKIIISNSSIIKQNTISNDYQEFP